MWTPFFRLNKVKIRAQNEGIHPCTVGNLDEECHGV